MIAIVDAGSSKSSWFIGDPSSPEKGINIELPGLNPVQDSEKRMENLLQPILTELKDNRYIQVVYYYGAGCSDSMWANQIKKVLVRLFPAAAVIVKDDLEGAARALCGNKPGIACILGTGSNAGYWDGHQLANRVINLGPILGDEGSGMDIGRRLLKAYLYEDLPDQLHHAFFNQFPFNRKEMMKQLYDHPKPHVWMAAFTPFAEKYKGHPIIANLIEEAIADFTNRHLLKLATESDRQVHFAGSIAHYFKKILSDVIAEAGLVMGTISRRPSEGLIRWHADNPPTPLG